MRGPRVYNEKGIYHVMFRGANKQDIFLDKRDYAKLLEIIEKIKEKKGFEIYAYCLMSNHVHLVIKERELKDISDIMKRIIGEYTQWFNFKYERTGGLVENRYKSQIVETDEYLIHLIRYVHQNPVKGGLVQSVEQYLWSSYGAYIGGQNPLINTELLFEILPKHSFVEFHLENESDEFELYYNRKYGDEDLIRVLKSIGIDNPVSLQHMPKETLQEILTKLPQRFSLRCISRVTGIHRSKLL